MSFELFVIYMYAVQKREQIKKKWSITLALILTCALTIIHVCTLLVNVHLIETHRNCIWVCILYLPGADPGFRDRGSVTF